MELSTFIYFLLSSIALTVVPGPDNLYLLAKSISDGAKQGIILAGGLAAGIIFHTTLVIIGVAAVIASTPVAFQLLKYLGAFYLFYLARQAYSAKPVPGKKMPVETAVASAGKPKTNGFATFRKGLLMNILNPKVLLFFLAFLPQFINPAGPEPGVQVAILGLTFSIQAFVIFTIIALCAGKLGNLINKNENSQIIMNKIQGLVLLIIGGFLLLF
ncbi:MAG: LysE family translocator [Veillonella sp.]|uniref:LysE family translocator n=1 Tax=Veillonella sp. TaxID=1926307 RepID=UPI0025D7924D|nr:LysE family translocator [Veillonella sp.]MBS4914260.1 LysE family translocator [Veillonella sp.]